MKHSGGLEKDFFSPAVPELIVEQLRWGIRDRLRLYTEQEAVWRRHVSLQIVSTEVETEFVYKIIQGGV